MPIAPYADQFLALVASPAFLRATLGGVPRLAKSPLVRVVVRPVDLQTGRRLQIARFDVKKDVTTHVPFADAPAALADVLAVGFSNVHVSTTGEEIDLRLTRKGDVQIGRKPKLPAAAAPGPAAHNRVKAVPLPEGAADPLLEAMGILDRHHRVRPTMRAKFTQINEFLKLLDPVLADVAAARTGDRPLQIVDCGCGASYLTLAAHHYVNRVRGMPAHTVGVDRNEEVVAKSRDKASALLPEAPADAPGGARLMFRTGEIGQGALADLRPDIVLALHACDTATDDALAQAVRAGAAAVLAVPCCHRDLNTRLAVPALRPVHRHGILHQRLADVVTDAFRALILRVMGYRADVIEFISPEHTARNLMIRAVKVAPPGDPAFLREYADFKAFTGVTPYLEKALGEVFPAGATDTP